MGPKEKRLQNANLLQDKNVERSRLGTVGLILSILLPPVGLIVSVIALNKIKKNHLSGKGKATFGIVWGAIFTLPALLVVWLIIVIKNNPAKNDLRPLASQIQTANGQKLCGHGDSGYSGDNLQPWYEIQYRIPDSPHLTNDLKHYAAQSGYSLMPDERLISNLKNIAAGPAPSDEPAYSARNDYLIASKPKGGTISVTVFRDTPVPINCGGTNYGQLQSPGSGSAIIDIELTLPSRA